MTRSAWARVKQRLLESRRSLDLDRRAGSSSGRSGELTGIEPCSSWVLIVPSRPRDGRVAGQADFRSFNLRRIPQSACEEEAAWLSAETQTDVVAYILKAGASRPATCSAGRDECARRPQGASTVRCLHSCARPKQRCLCPRVYQVRDRASTAQRCKVVEGPALQFKLLAHLLATAP